MFEHASRMGLEGIVSKRTDSLYWSVRTAKWAEDQSGRVRTTAVLTAATRLKSRPRMVRAAIKIEVRNAPAANTQERLPADRRGRASTLQPHDAGKPP
jgi:ATP-dependent DNA ligase